MSSIIVFTLFLTSIAIIPISPTESLAHRDGCHRWHSCPSHDGSYVCGDLGFNDECGSNGGNDEEESDNVDTLGRENGENGSRGDSNNGEHVSPSSSSTECRGQADCFTGTVTAIVDGDTIDVNNIRIRLSLVKA